MEAALLGTPMVTFYRVTTPSWIAGKLLVRVPFYSMVNLIAGRPIVPELMQSEMTGAALAREAGRLLGDSAARAVMCEGLALTSHAKRKQQECARKQNEIEVRTGRFHWNTEQYKPVAGGQWQSVANS